MLIVSQRINVACTFFSHPICSYFPMNYWKVLLIQKVRFNDYFMLLKNHEASKNFVILNKMFVLYLSTSSIHRIISPCSILKDSQVVKVFSFTKEIEWKVSAFSVYFQFVLYLQKITNSISPRKMFWKCNIWL